MIAAGNNPFVKAVVLVMPFTSGAFDAANYPPGILERFWSEREARLLGKQDEETCVPVWDGLKEDSLGERGQTLLHGEVAYDFISGAKARSDAAGTPWENKMTLDSFYHIAKVEPRDHIHKISPRPLLYLAATTDAISGPLEMQKEVFARAGEPKEFVELYDHHVGNYFAASFEKNVEVQIDFLKKNL